MVEYIRDLNHYFEAGILTDDSTIVKLAMEKMGEKLCKRLQSHRLNPLNNARFPMSYAVLNLPFCYVYAISKSLQMVCMK